ncbi:oxidoreductase [Streptomyces sp. NPDC046712]|uniref:oxidoreductase n=1 Tax=Streptomyces sp. NPDC046712 TaxID=3154802 RepID=UPI0033C5A5CA
MPAEYATFALAPAIRTGSVSPGGSHRAHRDFLDFVVDGRPLLFRLADLDAVSPLASDIPPAILTESVRGLLLDAEAPLAGGRHVIYGCPECDGLGCGAVTAVIERDGEDIVWRDFAWQTDDTADLDFNGYRGIGPYRFRGDRYRAELERLLREEPDEAAPAARRVLLIGARAAVLGRLAAALRTIGIGADIVHDTEGVTDDELRGYGAVAFGRAVTEEARAQVRGSFERAGVDVAYVEGLAPVVPVLVAQIVAALDPTPPERRRVTALAATGAEAVVEVTSAVGVQLVAYRLDRLYRTHEKLLLDDVLEPGTHRIALDAKAVKGQSFLVARTTGSELVVPVER